MTEVKLMTQLRAAVSRCTRGGHPIVDTAKGTVAIASGVTGDIAVSFLLNVPTCKVHPTDGSAEMIVLATTLRQRLQFKLTIQDRGPSRTAIAQSVVCCARCPAWCRVAGSTLL